MCGFDLFEQSRYHSCRYQLFCGSTFEKMTKQADKILCFVYNITVLIYSVYPLRYVRYIATSSAWQVYGVPCTYVLGWGNRKSGVLHRRFRRDLATISRARRYRCRMQKGWMRNSVCVHHAWNSSAIKQSSPPPFPPPHVWDIMFMKCDKVLVIKRTNYPAVVLERAQSFRNAWYYARVEYLCTFKFNRIYNAAICREFIARVKVFRFRRFWIVNASFPIWPSIQQLCTEVEAPLEMLLA